MIHLLLKDLNNEVIPWMVEDNYTVVDSKEFTFTLKDNLKFHNGNKLQLKILNSHLNIRLSRIIQHIRNCLRKLKTLML